MISSRNGRDVDVEESRPLLAASHEGVENNVRTSRRSLTSLWLTTGVIITLMPIITFMVRSLRPSPYPSSSYLRDMAGGALSSMHLQTSDSAVPGDIKQSSSICAITTTASYHASYDCKGSYINFIVPASPEGLWPSGLAYSLYEDASDNKGLLSTVHYEQGPANLPERTSCESFSSVLCLAGDFTLDVQKVGLFSSQESDATDADRNEMYVDICGSDHRVHAGESYKFSTYKMKCSSLSEPGLIPISQFQRNLTSTLDTTTSEKSSSLLDTVSNYFHEIFDPKPVADEPEAPVDLEEVLHPEITDPIPVSDEPNYEENVMKEVKLTDHISSTANAELSQESVVLKNSENIGQTADTIRDLILKHNKNSADFMTEINDKNAVTEEDYSAAQDEESILQLVKKISNLSDMNEATTSTLLASSSSTVQDANALGNLLSTNNSIQLSTPTKVSPPVSSKNHTTQTLQSASKVPVSPHKDGTMNPWSLNPQTGSSKVPVAKEDTTSKTAAAKPSLIKTKKKRRRLLGKGGVKNVEDTKSHMKHKNKVKKLKLREQASWE